MLADMTKSGSYMHSIKKSTHGIKTPQRDIDVIKKRLRTLKEV